jgi:hypothetical protein
VIVDRGNEAFGRRHVERYRRLVEKPKRARGQQKARESKPPPLPR